MTIEELLDYTIKSGLILLSLTVLDTIIQVLINRCDRKDMEDQ